MNTVQYAHPELSGADYLAPNSEVYIRVPIVHNRVQFQNFSTGLAMGRLRVSTAPSSVHITAEDHELFQVVDWLKTVGNDHRGGNFFETELAAIVLNKNESGIWATDLSKHTVRPGFQESFHRFVDMAIASAVERQY